jgi:hypothetical protein
VQPASDFLASLFGSLSVSSIYLVIGSRTLGDLCHQSALRLTREALFRGA